MLDDVSNFFHLLRLFDFAVRSWNTRPVAYFFLLLELTEL